MSDGTRTSSSIEPRTCVQSAPASQMTTVSANVAPRPRVVALSASTRRAALWLAAFLLVVAYVATRVLFIARFPYFLDEGTYAQFTYEAANSIHQLFVSLT